MTAGDSVRTLNERRAGTVPVFESPALEKQMAVSNVPQELMAMCLHPRTGVLAALLVAAAVIDWRTLRIPNWLTIGGILYALGFNTLVPPLQGGLGWALMGMGAGLAVLLPLWLLRLLGAGDVKLMAMVGAFVGVPETFGALLFSLIAGGIAAAGFALWRRKGLQALRNVQETLVTSAFTLAAGHAPSLAAMPSIGKLPYAIGICAGSLAWIAWRHLN